MRGDTVSSLFWSSAAITVLFSLAALALFVRRPFRVSCFNYMIIVGHLTLAANALIGNFMVRPPWEARDKFQLVSSLLVLLLYLNLRVTGHNLQHLFHLIHLFLSLFG